MSSAPVNHPGSPDPRPYRRRQPAVIVISVVLAILAASLSAAVLRGTAHASTSGAASATTTTGSMPGMGSGASTMPSGNVMTVRGAALPAMQTSGAMPMAMAMVPLGQATWQGMGIQARTSAPATFVLFNGYEPAARPPTAKDSFHLMVHALRRRDRGRDPVLVGLGDDHEGREGRLRRAAVADGLALHGAALRQQRRSSERRRSITLTLLVSPPVAARHMEYKGLWLKPHRVSMMLPLGPEDVRRLRG